MFVYLSRPGFTPGTLSVAQLQNLTRATTGNTSGQISSTDLQASQYALQGNPFTRFTPQPQIVQTLNNALQQFRGSAGSFSLADINQIAALDGQSGSLSLADAQQALPSLSARGMDVPTLQDAVKRVTGNGSNAISSANLQAVRNDLLNNTPANKKGIEATNQAEILGKLDFVLRSARGAAGTMTVQELNAIAAQNSTDGKTGQISLGEADTALGVLQATPPPPPVVTPPPVTPPPVTPPASPPAGTRTFTEFIQNLLQFFFTQFRGF